MCLCVLLLDYVLMCCCCCFCCHLMMCAEELGIRYGLFDRMGKERGGEEWRGDERGWKERAWWWLGWGLIAKMDEGMSMLVLFEFYDALAGLRDVRHVPH